MLIHQTISDTLAIATRHAARRGRPKGVIRGDHAVALAFCLALRTARLDAGVAQEEVALKTGVERSHMGRIARGEQMLTLGKALKLAGGMEASAADQVA